MEVLFFLEGEPEIHQTTLLGWSSNLSFYTEIQLNSTGYWLNCIALSGQSLLRIHSKLWKTIVFIDKTSSLWKILEKPKIGWFAKSIECRTTNVECGRLCFSIQWGIFFASTTNCVCEWDYFVKLKHVEENTKKSIFWWVVCITHSTKK